MIYPDTHVDAYALRLQTLGYGDVTETLAELKKLGYSHHICLARGVTGIREKFRTLREFKPWTLFAEFTDATTIVLFLVFSDHVDAVFAALHYETIDV